MSIAQPPNRFLIIAAALNSAAAFAHLGCIVFGAAWFRFLGAGEQMAQLAEAGHWYPTVAAATIAFMLFVWTLYALSGSGVIRRLPLLRTALVSIAAIYLLRGLLFVPLMPFFPGNSLSFWLVSSGICLVLGLVHAAGLRQTWARL